MSTALKQSVNVFAPAGLLSSKGSTSQAPVLKSAGHDQNLKRDLQLDRKAIKASRRDYVILGLLVILAHVITVHGYLRAQNTKVLHEPKKSEVVIEFVKPEPPPPPPPPPKIEPPKPKVEKIVPPAPKPVPVLKTPPAEEVITPEDITVPENTEAVRTSEPVVAAPSPPPEPPKEEPITEATGYAGYLNNPAPEYPAFAQRQGWEGKVVLRVRVLASGKPGNIEIRQSSGRKTLDEAALEVVRGWTFNPAKRGSTPIDGWATVPIEFKLTK